MYKQPTQVQDLFMNIFDATNAKDEAVNAMSDKAILKALRYDHL